MNTSISLLDANASADRGRWRRVIGIVVAVLFVLHGTRSDAQFRRQAIHVPNPQFVIGFFGGLNTNIHTGKFLSPEGKHICEQFTGGVGAGPAFGLDMMYNFDIHYGTELRLGYGSAYASWLSDRGQISLLDSNGRLLREHLFKPVLTYGTAEILFNFSPVQRKVQFMIGPTISYNIGKHFTQEEHIISADDSFKHKFVFPNGTTTMIVDQGDVGDLKSILFGAEIGVAFEFKLGRSLLFCPYAFSHFFLQNPSTFLEKWSILQFKLGLALRYVAAFDD